MEDERIKAISPISIDVLSKTSVNWPNHLPRCWKQPTQLAENLLSDMAKDAEVGSKTSSTTRLAKNSSASVHMVEDAEVGEVDGSDDEMVKKSSSKKSNGPTRYLTSLCFNADSVPFEKRWA